MNKERFDACLYYLEGSNKEVAQMINDAMEEAKFERKGHNAVFLSYKVAKMIGYLGNSDRYIRYGAACVLEQWLINRQMDFSHAGMDDIMCMDMRRGLLRLLDDEYQDIQEFVMCVLVSDVIIKLSILSSNDDNKNEKVKRLCDVIIKYVDEVKKR